MTAPALLRKKFSGLELKTDDKGHIEAVFSTFGVKDHDADWTLPEAFDNGAPVRFSAYGHRSWGGELPVGKGVIKTTSKDARVVGQFFMNTTNGRETFEVIKQMGDLGEWSYSLDDVVEGELTDELRQLGVRRVIKKVRVHEISPVLAGAGITRTVSAKCDACSFRIGAPVLPGKDLASSVVQVYKRFLKREFEHFFDKSEWKAGRMHPRWSEEAKLVASIVTNAFDQKIGPPAIRWFASGTPGSVLGKALGGDTGFVWVRCMPNDFAKTMAVVGHEVSHAVGDTDEQEAKRIELAVHTAWKWSRRLVVGSAEQWRNSWGENAGTLRLEVRDKWGWLFEAHYPNDPRIAEWRPIDLEGSGE